jgi:hypothetical protein
MKAGCPILCSHCDGIAYLARKEINNGDDLNCEAVERPDGTLVADSECITCFVCGIRASGIEIVDHLF